MAAVLGSMSQTGFTAGLVSVIIPAYNAQQTIEKTLKSVICQTFRAIEVIVVDDGSVDDTSLLVERQSIVDKRIVLIRTTNRGSAAARNEGYKLSRGEYIAFIDADDIWHPLKLERQVEAIHRASPDVGLVYAWTRMIDCFDHVEGNRGAYSLKRGRVLRDIVRHNFVGNGSVALIRRRCLPDPPFDPSQRGNEDVYLYIKIAQKWKFEVVPSFLIGYRWNTGSNQTNQIARLFYSRKEMIGKIQNCGGLSKLDLKICLFDCVVASARVLLKKHQYTRALKLIMPMVIRSPYLIFCPPMTQIVLHSYQFFRLKKTRARPLFHDMPPEALNAYHARTRRVQQRRYVWLHNNGTKVHGGLKATDDANRIALTAGWTPYDTSLMGSPMARVRKLIIQICKLSLLDKGSKFFVQLPAYGLGNKLILYFILLKFRCVGLVHDLDRARLIKGGSSERCIGLCDEVIFAGGLLLQCQKPPVRSYACLPIWDYLCETAILSINWSHHGAILFAGNLSANKVPWLYDGSIVRPPIHIYGNGLDQHLSLQPSDRYYGHFDPNKPLLGEEALSWGLVWDGRKVDSEKTIEDDYEYINQPHKLSLYLACGLPVIVWKHSFSAIFVSKNRCGILVDSLRGINEAVASVDQRSHAAMRTSALMIAKKLRAGEYLTAALSNFEN